MKQGDPIQMSAEESMSALRSHPVYSLLQAERAQQDAQWGVQNHDNERWLTILMEEIGEAAKAITEDISNQKYSHAACIENLEIELIQSAAVILAWIECLRRNKIGTENEKRNPR